MAAKSRGEQALPAEFLKLGLHFHQDIEHAAATFEGLAPHLVGGFSDRERPVLGAFLTDIVSSGSTEELRRMWSTACVDWWFEDGEDVRRLLAAVRDELGRGRTRPGWAPVGEGRNHARRIPGSKRR